MKVKYDKLNSLETMLTDLHTYLVLVVNCLEKTASQQEIKATFTLNSEISSNLGYLQTLIDGLCAPFAVNLTNEWFKALKLPISNQTQIALFTCIQATNKAIGKMKDDIRIGTRNKQGIIKEKFKTRAAPKAFIVHGGKSGVLDKLCDFIEALGIDPLVVEMLPSKGMTVVDKVKKYQREADCAVILATRGGIIDIKSGKQHPRLNVVDELSSFWEAFPQKVILLLEKGATLPSNKAGLTHEPFTRQSMDRAFIAIARELVEMKILVARKPPTL